MKKKFELTEETIEWNGCTLHRIKALKDFETLTKSIKKGELGGWVEKEGNLSQKDKCWIYYEAKVYGNAFVSEDALIFNEAQVYDNAKVCDDAMVSDNAKVYGNAIVQCACVEDNAKVYGNSIVWGDAIIFDNSKIYGHSQVYDMARIADDAQICGESEVYGRAWITGNAIIKEKGDYIVFQNIWSSCRFNNFFTWTKSDNMWKISGFYGTGTELIKEGEKESEICAKMYKKYVNFVETSIMTDNEV